MVSRLREEATRGKWDQVLGGELRSIHELVTALFQGQVIESREAGICHSVTFTKMIVWLLSTKIYQIL
jgi:hypothetical protein